MKKLTRVSVLILAMATILISCKKDKDDDISQKTKLLTTGQWKIAAFTSSPAQDYDLDGDTETDIFPLLLPCEYDSYTTFAVDGTGENNEGANVCAGEPQSQPFTWSFGSNETRLLFDGEDAAILELSSTILKLNITYEENGVDYTMTFTLVH